MYLLLIRHGESEADLLNVHEGRADFPLTERGIKQAEKMADFVEEKYKITKIYASPLKRAKETAKILAAKISKEIYFDDDLMEFNNGLLAGLDREVAKEKYPERKDLKIDESMYEMESKLAFRQRAKRVLEGLMKEREEDVIAVISHGRLINELYRAMLNLPIDTETYFLSGDTGLHLWKVEKEKFVVIKANEGKFR